MMKQSFGAPPFVETIVCIHLSSYVNRIFADAGKDIADHHGTQEVFTSCMMNTPTDQLVLAVQMHLFTEFMWQRQPQERDGRSIRKTMLLLWESDLDLLQHVCFQSPYCLP